MMPPGRLPVLIVALVLTIPGCQTVPRQSAFLESTKLDISAGELRARTYSQGRLLSLGIEQAADSILGVTSVPETRRNALLWKMSSIPALQEATLAPDPLIAAMDLYAYMVQTRDYFEHGDGAKLFGAEQAIIVAGMPRLVAGTREFAVSVAGEHGVATGVGGIEKWAHEHPVRGPYFLRESLVGDWSQVFGSSGGSAFATLGHMEQSVEEISERLQFINETMLKQVRWNAELLMSGIARPEDLEAARVLLARANELTAGLPDLLSRERIAVLDAIRAERIAAFLDIDRQRQATIGVLQSERALAFEMMRSERAIILEAMRAERIGAMASVDSIVRRSMNESSGLVDHVFWRLAQLVGAYFVAGGLALLLVIRWWRPLTGRR